MSGHSHNPHGSFKHRSQYGGTIWNAENRYYTQSLNSRSGESVRTQLINLAEMCVTRLAIWIQWEVPVAAERSHNFAWRSWQGSPIGINGKYR